jgi:hypothetical protein
MSKFAFNSLFRKLPLRIVLIVPFVLQIVGTVGLIGYLSFKNGQKVINNLANQLRQETGDRIEENLDNYLTVLESINQSNAAALKLGVLNSNDLTQIKQFFWQQMQIFDQVSAVMITTENKDFLIIERVQNNKLILRMYNKSTHGIQYNYLLDEDGKKVKMINSHFYDPHNDPPQNTWYLATKQASQPLWKHTVSAAKGHQEPVVILANFTSFYEKNNKFGGVISSAFHLNHMDNFLESLNIGKTVVYC